MPKESKPMNLRSSDTDNSGDGTGAATLEERIFLLTRQDQLDRAKEERQDRLAKEARDEERLVKDREDRLAKEERDRVREDERFAKDRVREDERFLKAEDTRQKERAEDRLDAEQKAEMLKVETEKARQEATADAKERQRFEDDRYMAEKLAREEAAAKQMELEAARFAATATQKRDEASSKSASSHRNTSGSAVFDSAAQLRVMMTRPPEGAAATLIPGMPAPLNNVDTDKCYENGVLAMQNYSNPTAPAVLANSDISLVLSLNYSIGKANILQFASKGLTDWNALLSAILNLASFWGKIASDPALQNPGIFRRVLLTLHTDVSIVSVLNPELTAKTATLLVNVRLNSLRGCDAISTNSLDPACDVDNRDVREGILRTKLAFHATSPDVVALLQSQSVARLAKLEEKFSQVQASGSGGKKGDAPPGIKPSEQKDDTKVSVKRQPRIFPPLPADCPSFITARAIPYNQATKKGWQTCFRFAESGSPCSKGDECRHMHSWPTGTTPAEKIAYIRYISECKVLFGWE